MQRHAFRGDDDKPKTQDTRARMSDNIGVITVIVLTGVVLLLSSASLVISSILLSRQETHSAATNTTSPGTVFINGQATAVNSMTYTLVSINDLALYLMGLDNTPVQNRPPGNIEKRDTGRVYGEQLGPTRTSRCAAMLHWAVYEAMVASTPAGAKYASLLDPAPKHSLFKANSEVAMAEAARVVSNACYQSMDSEINPHFDRIIAAYPNGIAKSVAVEIGQAAAEAVLALRENDGAKRADPMWGIDYNPANAGEPGVWSPDPVSGNLLALGAYWGDVEPFIVKSAKALLPPPPPALDSKQYADEYNEVLTYGARNSVFRSTTQTMLAVFYGYDAVPELCAPPRLYNQLAMALAHHHGIEGAELVKLLATVNMALADAVIAAWHAKYHYSYWRPVTAIRRAAEDGNLLTIPDPDFVPLGISQSNTLTPASGFTPAFPDYVSGHATMGGVIAQVFRCVTGTDVVRGFEFTSDEFNGKTKNHNGDTRQLWPHHIDSLSQLEQENGQSRIDMGIHFASAKTQGILLGRAVAEEAVRAMYGLTSVLKCHEALAVAEKINP
jgi:hypothetical protein